MNHSKSYSGTTNTITEYDEKGNLIHYRDSTGFESWCEYGANNNQIHYRNSNGIEENY